MKDVDEPVDEYGGDGDDTITAAGNSTLYGEGGDDTLSSDYFGRDSAVLSVYGGSGNDTLNFNNAGLNILDAGDGDDSVSIHLNTHEPTSISGGAGYDTLTISNWYQYWSKVSNDFEELIIDGGERTFLDSRAASGTSTDTHWRDSYVRFKISDIDYIESHGIKHYTQAHIPNGEHVAITYSGTLPATAFLGA